MKIEAVIFDWAGTTVDYGCFAPLAALQEAFRQAGIEITEEEVRKPMGLLKIDHIRQLLAMDRINFLWREKYGREPSALAVNELNSHFETMLFSVLAGYAVPIPGVVDTVAKLRSRGLKIGSTTGYTGMMAAVVAENAKKQGYAPDFIATPDDVPTGRPQPFMCYLNAAKLGVANFGSIVKVGDTISDIKEGLAAGCWSVGVVYGSSELGLSEKQVETLPPEEIQLRVEAATSEFYNAGAHYVIEKITALEKLIELIDQRPAAGSAGR